MFMRVPEKCTSDSKAGGRKAVWVRFPPRAPSFDFRGELPQPFATSRDRSSFCHIASSRQGLLRRYPRCGFSHLGPNLDNSKQARTERAYANGGALQWHSRNIEGANAF